MADQLPVTIKLVRRGKDLVITTDLSRTKLDLFIRSLEEGQEIHATYETISVGGSYAQLSKLHKCIRELASYTGETFEDMKLQVKLRAGLCLEQSCKSFGECSKDELSLAIQAAIEIGDMVGFNLH